MGDWDYYCALCGAGFGGASDCLPSREEFERIQRMHEEGGDYDREDMGHLDPIICSHESTDWLKHLRLLGHNRHGKEGRGVWLSGLGRADCLGGSEVEFGDHPNVHREFGPERQCWFGLNDGKLQISVYLNVVQTGDAPIDWPLPFHERCFQMIRRTISGEPNGQIDLDSLYDAMGTKRGGLAERRDPREYNNSSLFLDYYQFADAAREQYWGVNTRLEPWYNDPIDIPAIPKLLNSLPHAAPPPEEKASDPNKDPFARLPLELLVELIMRLPKESLLPLFLSSRAARLASRSQWVWKKRLLIDMPWLWEVAEKEEYLEEVDWQAVYGRLHRSSFPGEWHGIEVGEGGITPEQRLDLDLSGLASRCRIWKCCEQVRELYEKVLRGDIEYNRL